MSEAQTDAAPEDQEEAPSFLDLVRRVAGHGRQIEALTVAQDANERRTDEMERSVRSMSERADVRYEAMMAAQAGLGTRLDGVALRIDAAQATQAGLIALAGRNLDAASPALTGWLITILGVFALGTLTAIGWLIFRHG